MTRVPNYGIVLESRKPIHVIGSYMSITIEDKRIGRIVARKQRLQANRKYQSTLIQGMGDNPIVCEVLLRLRSTTAPKVGGKCRKLEERIEPLTLMFYSKRAEDFVRHRTGRLSRSQSRATAQVRRFEGTVTVTRHNQDGKVVYVLSEGLRSLTIGERKIDQDEYEYALIRSSGFAQPTGRVAGYRSPGRTPIFDSDR